MATYTPRISSCTGIYTDESAPPRYFLMNEARRLARVHVAAARCLGHRLPRPLADRAAAPCRRPCRRRCRRRRRRRRCHRRRPRRPREPPATPPRRRRPSTTSSALASAAAASSRRVFGAARCASARPSCASRIRPSPATRAAGGPTSATTPVHRSTLAPRTQAQINADIDSTFKCGGILRVEHRRPTSFLVALRQQRVHHASSPAARRPGRAARNRHRTVEQLDVLCARRARECVPAWPDTGHCSGHADYPPPPGPPPPSRPPYPPPPPNNPMDPLSCSLLAPWFTYREDVRQMPRRRRDQCRGIIEWYCARDDTVGKGSFSGTHVYDYFCLNGEGTAVYCQQQFDINNGGDGTNSCEGEATCIPFTPVCNGRRQHARLQREHRGPARGTVDGQQHHQRLQLSRLLGTRQLPAQVRPALREHGARRHVVVQSAQHGGRVGADVDAAVLHGHHHLALPQRVREHGQRSSTPSLPPPVLDWTCRTS